MALTPSSVKRPIVATGDDLLTLQEAGGKHIQAVTQVDESGNQSGTSSNPIHVNVDNHTYLSGRVSSDYDLFGRGRSSSPVTLFESSLNYDNEQYQWNEDPNNTGTVTYNAIESAVFLEVTSGQYARRKSREHFKLQAGKSNVFFLTAGINQHTGVNKRVGAFNNVEGVFLLNDGVYNYFGIRTEITGSVTETLVRQDSWNIDTFDGNGDSGFTLDISKVQILVFEIQGSGAGEIKVGFSIDGHTSYAHEFYTSNVESHTTFSANSLQVTYEIESISGTGKLEQYHSAVISEGGQSSLDDAGYVFAVDNHTTPRTITSGGVACLAVRPKTTFKGKSFKGKLYINEFSFFAISARMHWELILNPTISGGTWTDVHADSATQKNVGITSFSGGTSIASGYDDRKSTGDHKLLLSKVQLVCNFDFSSSDVIALVAYDIANDGGSVFASCSVVEAY